MAIGGVCLCHRQSYDTNRLSMSLWPVPLAITIGVAFVEVVLKPTDPYIL